MPTQYGTKIFGWGALTSLSLLASCQSPTMIAQKEDHLAAAGFAFKLADTPARQQMLSRLPAHHFVRRVTGGQAFYVYSDPTVCDCLYVGDQTAYAQYQQYRQAKALADEQQETAMDYQDAQWNWGTWGPGMGGGWYGWNPAWGSWDPGMGSIGW
ncbi:hypothetical protein [Acetobacter okinawensis]|uniref:hypothetical protein n=1 Tax=Acetobacter okinawensis TaxID=1076594 RepID=UPI00068443F9|nr:hypothetical protein [Acetobacter okinawensis]